MSFQPTPSPFPVADPRRAGSGPMWNTVAAAIVSGLVLAYIAAAGVEIVMQQLGASDAAAVSAASGGASLNALQTLDARIQSHIATMNAVNLLYQLVFWVMFIAFFGWNAILRSRLRALGRNFDRRSMKAWWIWRAGMILSILMIFVAQSGGTPDSPDAAVSQYHRMMAYFAVRAAVGVAYLWVVYSVWRSAGPEFAAAYATPPGYPMPPQGYPMQPQGYPPAPMTYYPVPDQTVRPPYYAPPAPQAPVNPPTPWGGDTSQS
jgi:hypothetical protein